MRKETNRKEVVSKVLAERIAIRIEPKRLTLRNLTVKDVSEEYVNWLNDSDINKYLSTSNIVQTSDSCIAYVESFEGRNDVALVGIFLKDKNTHIGNLTLFPPIDWLNRKASVGISIGRKEYQGMGYAEEALNAIKEYCFKRIKLHHLWAGVNVDNIASIKLFQKCGFKIDGLLRDPRKRDGEFRYGYTLSVFENGK